METRPFGSTGERVPILSFGAQRIVDEHNCTEEQAIAILREQSAAIHRGIRYFDTAWIYSRGQSEERVGKVARHRRHLCRNSGERCGSPPRPLIAPACGATVPGWRPTPTRGKPDPPAD